VTQGGGRGALLRASRIILRENELTLTWVPLWLLNSKPFLPLAPQFIRTVTEIRGEWLLDLAPHYYDLRNFPQSGAKRALEKIVARRRN
jgi:hypothetical protein